MRKRSATDCLVREAVFDEEEVGEIITDDTRQVLQALLLLFQMLKTESESRHPINCLHQKMNMNQIFFYSAESHVRCWSSRQCSMPKRIFSMAPSTVQT